MDGNKILKNLAPKTPAEPPATTPAAPRGAARAAKVPKADEEIEEKLYYDQSQSAFWGINGHGEWAQLSETQLKRELRWHGYSKDKFTDRGLTVLEDAIRRLQRNQSVHFAGEFAGYFPGHHDICGFRILVTRGPKIPTPVEGKWDTLEHFFTELLGEEVKYFHAWVKAALLAMKAGPPFRPGQLLAVAGPAGCGKSLLQEIITEILGGRVAQPYKWMSGATEFNGDLMRAEHLAIEDQAASTDMRSRRALAGRVKQLTVNRVQDCHPKGAKAFPAAPFWRTTITVNNDQDHLMVMPPLDDSIMDKIIVLLAHRVNFPFDGQNLDTRKLYRSTLTKELPHYLYWLRRWRMPKALEDQRFGCVSYQNEELKKALMDNDPHYKLWTMIQALGVVDRGYAGWEGKAIELEIALRKRDTTGEIARLLYYNTACGVHLQRLSELYPQNVVQLRKGGNTAYYKITMPEDDIPEIPN